MQYPLISEYITAIRSGEDTFDKLSHLRPVLDDTGNPVMSSGNFAVVFKMTDGTKLYALKCFLKEQGGRDEAYKMITEELEDVSSTYIIHIAYFEKELFVDTHNCQETEFPVLLMDWVDGLPLDIYLKNHLNNSDDLKLLAYRFCNLAGWLLTQPFAHGDIKPDNILVDVEGNLILVDYDGMYVPKMAAQQARELGSPDYCHPYRTKEQFDEHIDDFSLTVIALSLKAISLDVSLLDCKTAGDGLLFSAKDYFNLAESDLFKKLPNLFYDNELEQLYALFLLVHSSKFLPNISYNYFDIKKPDVPIYKEGELICISEGVKMIYNNQFRDNKRVKCIVIPNSVIKIGYCAFAGCTSLQTIIISNNVVSIDFCAFEDCRSLETIMIPSSVKTIGGNIFHRCISLHNVYISNNVSTIPYSAFEGCISLREIVIPNNVTQIESRAFQNCTSLQNIKIPNGVSIIGSKVFHNCISLNNIVIPDTVTKIEPCAFQGCISLQTINIPNSVLEIGGGIFNNCSINMKLNSNKLSIVDGMVLYEDRLNSCLNGVVNASIPSNIIKIDPWAFQRCSSLKNVILPDSITHIGWESFSYCESLQTIILPNSVTHIDGKAFWGCYSLQPVNIPHSVFHIGFLALPF